MSEKSENEGHILGIGGIFIQSPDRPALIAWYKRVLGFPYDGYGASFSSGGDGDTGTQLWSPFKDDSNYFAPSEKSFMLNLRVRDLDALIVKIRAEGVELVGEPESHDEGKFAWIMDPDGTKIELWQESSSLNSL